MMSDDGGDHLLRHQTRVQSCAAAADMIPARQFHHRFRLCKRNRRKKEEGLVILSLSLQRFQSSLLIVVLNLSLMTDCITDCCQCKRREGRDNNKNIELETTTRREKKFPSVLNRTE